MAMPPTSDSQVQEEEIGSWNGTPEAIVNEDLVKPRGFDDSTEKIDEDVLQPEGKPCTEPGYREREDFVTTTSPSHHIPREQSRQSSNRFLQATESFENLDREPHQVDLGIVTEKKPPPNPRRSAVDFANVSYCHKNDDQAERFIGGRSDNVASGKNGVGANSAWSRMTFGGKTTYTQLLGRGRLPIQPPRHFGQENVYDGKMSYVHNEVYPPWPTEIPRGRDAAKAFVDPAPYVKAFSCEEPPQTSSSSTVVGSGRCVICDDPLPYGYVGDTCCQCGGRICEKCIDGERIHWHY